MTLPGLRLVQFPGLNGHPTRGTRPKRGSFGQACRPGIYSERKMKLDIGERWRFRAISLIFYLLGSWELVGGG